MPSYVVFSEPLNCAFLVSELTFSIETQAKAGGAARMAQPHAVAFRKTHDEMSGLFLTHSARGTVFKWVWIEIYRENANSPLLTYKLEGVVIETFVVEGRGHEAPRNAITLNFTTMAIDRG